MILTLSGVLVDATVPAAAGVAQLEPEQQDLAVPAGDDVIVRVKVKRQDGAAGSLAGTAVLALKKYEHDAAAAIARAGVFTAADTIEFTFTGAELAALSFDHGYAFDVVYTDGGGKRWQVVPKSEWLALPVIGTASLVPTLPNPFPSGIVMTAANVGVVDAAGYFAAGTVEAALAEIGHRIALWDPTLMRYFFVDNETGDDSRVGYIDAAAGTIFTPEQIASVAIKTLKRFFQIFPKFGNGRMFVALFKSRAAGDNYVDGVTQEDMDWRGCLGYRFALRRASTDLTNSADDRIRCGFVTALAGPGPGGAFTIDAGATNANFPIQGGALLPAEDSLGKSSITGYRVRFTTGALAGTCHFISSNTTTAIIPGANAASIPAQGDQFVIERPGLRVGKFIDWTLSAARYDAGGSAFSDMAVGFCATSTDTGTFVYGGPGAWVLYAGCEVLNDTAGGLVGHFGTASLQIARNWTDETGALRSIGMGGRFNCGAGLNVPSLTVNLAAIAFTASNRVPQIGSAVVQVGAVGSYFGGGARIFPTAAPAGTATTSLNASSRFGSFSSTERKMRVRGQIVLNGFCRVVNANIEQCGANACIAVRGMGFAVNVDGCDGSAGNNDVVISMVDAWGCAITIGAYTGNGAMATQGALGRVRASDGGIFDYATLATAPGRDRNGNVYLGAGVAPVVTASLPAAGALPNGSQVVEDAGGGVRNLVLYENGQRHRIAGAAF